MHEFKDNTTNSTISKTKARLIAGLLGVFIIMAIVSMVNIIIIQISYSRAVSEYDSLRELAPVPVSPAPSSVPEPVVEPWADTSNDVLYIPDTPPAEDVLEEEPVLEMDSAALSAINPDFIGWITVDGTDIDYPVVQGTDNSRYLNTTFSGANNRSGAIFMDYRIEEGFDNHIVILYGHNMRNGAMFGTLSQTNLNDNITIITADNVTLTYRILEIRTTDALDTAYALIYGDLQSTVEYLQRLRAPDNAFHMLMLSTCLRTNRGGADVVIDLGTDTIHDADEYGSRDDIGRMIVFAYLVE